MILLIVSFIAGALTVLAPCILPLLPVVLGGAVADAGNRRRPFIIIASLSASVFVFTLLLKGSTALINVSPSFWSYVSATILALFGLTLMFPEAWARVILKIPGHNKPDAWLSKGALHKSTWWTDVLIGAALGPVFTTCSPTFFVILATVLPQSLSMGIIDLLAYIVGLALMLLLVALIGQKLVNHVQWAADPKGWFRRILGLLFVVLAVLIAFGLDKKIETAILDAGFFDVTTLEDSVKRSLEKPLGSPSTGNNPRESGATEGTSTQKAPSSLFTPKPDFIEIEKPAGFVNSQPFKLADLVGKKVILIDFIDYSCINCERTFPYLNDWYAKYKDQGLQVVAIHTPEFSFEKNIKNVEDAAKQYKLQFPIVLDNDYATWNAYHNDSWPHKYLIDIHGVVVFDHIGEGAYDETEAKIVALLNDRKKFLNEAGTVRIGANPMPAQNIAAYSPETYFGSGRNEFFGNGQPFTAGQADFTVPSSLVPNTFYLGGNWRIQGEYAENVSAGAQLSYVFKAANMYLVADIAGATSLGSTTLEAKVMIDGKPISAEDSGVDVKDGMLTIKGSRLFHIYKNTTAGVHRVDIIFTEPGIRVYTFTFG